MRLRPEEIRESLEEPVMFEGSEYILTGAIFRKGKDGYYYELELSTKNRRSVVIVKIENVDKKTKIF